MRIVFVGASNLTVTTARLAIERKHEVVIIELNQEKIDELSGDLDCGFIQGNGSLPDILEEVSPENTDFLICITNNDQDNIIASLLGHKIEFDHVITRIKNSAFDTVCKELKLENVFNPDKQVAQALIDQIEGNKQVKHSIELDGELIFFKFQIAKNSEKKFDALELPEDTKLVCVFRGEKSYLPSDLEVLKEGDVVTLLSKENHIEELSSKFKLKEENKNGK